MAAVTAAMVKELREMTGAGMMDCKKALAATDGDMEKAVEYTFPPMWFLFSTTRQRFLFFLAYQANTPAYRPLPTNI